ncbi:hypothetical protein PtrSN002B_005219 [Pyrenophora tritici-repentis]|uniref:FAP multi-domain protein n=2 Tax=Pyrenophora tritici-repentis TaxID=45151 RepID=A0A2W1E9F7_9PLEO|nr:uncharacterized protein PTRG_01046 [Pyrenophora tritici-repentis Pt-1C-BFP]KAA8625683.1 hypothetical protein PtrV1_01363 [Pyrenophora tritici-repentis]EDU40484.1 hypothetical protein PTRG_01046 [Pyrenophora tritici-repentis Pt-1C-BFP]KAF7454100.1 hypothetical protein A1F99_013580 [Pyrenophora tritici-repentis]KAF7577189.1 FAP multi-domain protein [Pyrenophora tritici-repentis]KAG9387848.1 hypothetical protein A1F94_000740 [Pyrenophora tritici-repentis]
MSTVDTHPRLLALSLSPSPRNSTSTSRPTPTSSANPSTSSTPLATSRRASHDSAHDAHHFVNLDKEQHEHKLNASLKKMWAGVKRHAVEHHRSVNAAYMASYGCGAHPGR